VTTPALVYDKIPVGPYGVRRKLRKIQALLGFDTLVNNSLHMMLTTAMMGALGFAFWVVSARLFSAEEVGVATTLIGATSLISYLSLFGLNSSVIRFLPVEADHDAQISTALVLVAGGGLAVATAYVLAVPMFAPTLSLVRSPLHAIGFVVLTACSAVNLLTDSVFIAYRSARYNLVVDGCIQSGVKLALPIALVGLGAYGIFAASGLAAAAALGSSVFFLVRSFGFRFKLRVDRDVIRRTFRYSAANYVGSVLNIVPIMVVPVLVLNGRRASDAAFYYMAFQVANLFNAVAYAISQSLFAEGSYAESDLRRLVRRSALLLGVIVVPATAVCMAGANLVLHVFGPSYARHGTGALVVLSLAIPAVALNSWTTSLLRLSKQLGTLIWSNVVFAVGICGLSALWVSRGLTWVALAWLVGNLASGVIGGLAFMLRPQEEPVGIATGSGL
jgi:O-antigen/teichoic acid export membrane protein